MKENEEEEEPKPQKQKGKKKCGDYNDGRHHRYHPPSSRCSEYLSFVEYANGKVESGMIPSRGEKKIEYVLRKSSRRGGKRAIDSQRENAILFEFTHICMDIKEISIVLYSLAESMLPAVERHQTNPPTRKQTSQHLDATIFVAKLVFTLEVGPAKVVVVVAAPTN